MERFKKEVDECENFEHRQGLTEKYIIDGIQAKYTQLKLQSIAPWGNGTLPKMYANPKHKDPIKKTRIIASYYNFPLRKLYKLASKAGTWLLRKLPKKYRHFTLHSIGDITQRLTEGMKWINRCFKKETELISFQTDVKQMYTNL